MASGEARNYLIKIDLTLADNTVLHLTEADIWQDSFAISTASSGTSSFDIGCAVIGKCSFTMNNIDGDFDDYDFFNANAVVWLGLVGDVVSDVQQYYRMGFYTVDEPQKANGLISLELLDNMWKFDVPLSEVTINYPATALSIVQSMCSYCGVSLAGTSANFHGYDFQIAEEPKNADNMNCREMLQYIAMIGCNFCTINDGGYLVIKWYDTSATASTTDVFELNKSTSFGTEDITITGVKFVLDKTEYKMGTDGYVLTLENPLVTTSNVSAVLTSIWGVLSGFTLRTFNCTTASDLAVEIGDKCKVMDYKGNYIYSWVTNNSFKLAGHQLQCNAEPPNRTLVKRYSKTVQAAVEVARQQTNEIISNYDLAVQMMNDLAVNSMGGYEEYEDLSTGGRVWYLSNMPITKNPTTGVCSFEPNSIVYKRTGSGFFVSRDGGLTWTNGYDPQTGELVVNVLDAIGINFDWARGGTLTLGGYGNGNGVLSILNALNVEKVHGDNTGIKVGGTVGSRLHITTDGAIEFDYDNAYGGTINMSAINYGTQQDPDIRDTFSIFGFDDLDISSSASKSRIHLSTDEDEDEGELSLHVEDGSIELSATDSENPSDVSSLEVASDGIHLNPNKLYVNGNEAQTGTVGVIGGNWKSYSVNYVDGIYVEAVEGNEVPHVEWHKWSNSQYVAIILAAGTTQAVFPDCDNTDDELAYEPFIKSANGTSPPQITDISQSGTDITVTFTAVTSAQAAGNACAIRLLRIRG